MPNSIDIESVNSDFPSDNSSIKSGKARRRSRKEMQKKLDTIDTVANYDTEYKSSSAYVNPYANLTKDKYAK